MTRSFKPSAATAIATVALVAAVGGGTAFAVSSTLPVNSVGNAQLQQYAVSNSKIGESSVSLNKLTASAQKSLRGQTGPAGPAGPAGPTTPVTTLTGTWTDHSGGGGSSSIGKNGVQLSGTGTAGYAGISTTSLNAFTPAELSTITYTASYTGAAGNNAEPYFKLKLTGSDGSCGNDDVLYAPDAQAPTLSYQGETQTFNVTAPYSTVGVHGDDAQPTDGNYPTAIHSTTGGVDESNEKICLAEIIFDGGSGASGGTATVTDVTFSGAGLPSRTYTFGS